MLLSTVREEGGGEGEEAENSPSAPVVESVT